MREKERKKDVNTYVKDRQKKIEKKRKRKGEVNATKTNKQTKNSPKRRKCDKMAHRFFGGSIKTPGNSSSVKVLGQTIALSDNG